MKLPHGNFLALLTVFGMLAMVFSDLPTQAAQCRQGAIALRAGKQLISAARAGSPSKFAATLSAYADMRKIALAALGLYRKQVPASKIRRYANVVNVLISKTFNNYRRKFQAQRMEFVGCRGNRVHTRALFPGRRGYQPVVLRFSGNRIIDINI